MKTFYFSLLLFLTGAVHLYAQTKVSGHVYDEFNYPVPYANVVFKGTSVGTITDENGTFYLEDAERYTTIKVSFMSYKTQEIQLPKKVNYDLKIVLKEDVEALDEVFIASGKQSKKNNPAIDLLRKVWKNKRSNGLKKYKQYRYDAYEKVEFDLNTIDSALVKSRLFRDMEFVFNQVDTSSVTGKTYLPIFINESASTIYGDNVLKLKKTVLRGNRNSGFSNSQTIVNFVQDMYADYNVYNNYIQVYNKSFTSPLSRTGVDVYNYVLADSAYISNKWCYNIVYYPRRKNELTFKGDFWVADTTYAIKDINMQASKNANINWIKDLYIEQEFEVLNDSVFLLKRDYMMTDFTIAKKEKSKGVYGKRTTIYDNHVFDQEKSEDFYAEEVYNYREDIYNRKEEFWKNNRLETLSKDEKGVYKMLDTLKTIGRFRRMLDLGAIVATNYYRFDKFKFDYGPLLSTIGMSAVEGLRLRVGGRTHIGPNDKWRVSGFGAYGFKDDKFKYGLSAKTMLNQKSRFILSAHHRRDIEQTAASLTSSNGLLGRSFASSSVFTLGGVNDKLTNVNLSVLSLEMEPFKNIVFNVSSAFKTLSSASKTFNLDYYDKDAANGISSKVRQYESSFSVTYYPRRKMSGFGVERRYRGKKNFSRLFLELTRGNKSVLNSDFDYSKLQMSFTKPWLIGGLGRLTTTVEAGKTFGEVPLALLSVLPGNQSVYTIKNAFTNLQYYEFVTDSYATLLLKHNFNGRIFSRIPFLRKLNLREIVGFRAATGTISSRNIALNASNIRYLAPESKPYYEYSVGVGNIFKLLRVDFNFRGNYLDNPEARPFGVTVRFGFSF